MVVSSIKSRAIVHSILTKVNELYSFSRSGNNKWRRLVLRFNIQCFEIEKVKLGVLYVGTLYACRPSYFDPAMHKI